MEIKIADFLDETESNDLTSKLTANRINSQRVINNASIRRVGALYDIYVDEEQADKAASVLDDFQKTRNRKKAKNKIRCPKCQSFNVEQKKGMSIMRKLFSLGTITMICNKCKTEWYV